MGLALRLMELAYAKGFDPPLSARFPYRVQCTMTVAPKWGESTMYHPDGVHPNGIEKVG